MRRKDPNLTKIKLEESPYTYVRTTVMRTLLIPKEEYNKMQRMGLAEISNYLGESQYKREFNELGVRLSGITLIEQALNRNFRRTMEKLKQISPDSFNAVIDAYLLKYDIHNVKTLMRAKISKISEEDTKELLLSFGTITQKQLDSLMIKENIEEILKALPAPLKSFVTKEVLQMKLMDIETELDHFYYNKILNFSEELPKQGIIFKKFLFSIIHTTNLLTFLRLKKEKVDSKEIAKHIFFTEDEKQNSLFNRLLKTKTKEEVSDLIGRSRYKKVIDTSKLEALIPIESALRRYLYTRTLHFQRQNPLSVYVILGFMFEKEMEIDNIKKIVKAKHLGISMDRVELVIA